MIVVHHLENLRSQRVLWLLEAFGLPYVVKRYSRRRTMAAPPELKMVHPLGKSPVIEDGGRVVAETGAIIEYLVRRAGGRFGPDETESDRLRWHYHLHYAEGSVMLKLMMLLTICFVPLVGRAGVLLCRRMVTPHLAFIEAELAARPWFAGDGISAADVMMSFPIELAAAKVNGLRGRPRTAGWLATIQGRPAYQAALQRGGPYRLA